MSSEYRYIEARQLEAGQEFGRMLRRWRELNNWTQYTAYKWAKEAGFEVMAPSTLSVAIPGRRAPVPAARLPELDLGGRPAMAPMRPKATCPLQQVERCALSVARDT